MVKINPSFKEFIFKETPKSEEYEQYRRFWQIIPSIKATTEFPIHLDVEVSRYCDLKCNFCAREYITDDKKNGFMDFELFKKIFESGTPMSLKPNWLGESVYHPKLSDMIKICKDNSVVDTIINTNGVSLTPLRALKLVKVGVDKIAFSAESYKKDVYEKYRIGANFDRLIRHIEYLIELRDKYGNPEIRIQKVRLPELEKENKKYVKFYKELGVNSVAFNSYKEKDPNKESDFKVSNCAQIYQRLLVDINGNVHPCCGDQNNRYILGNIKEKTIREIWHSEKMNKLRRYSEKGELYKLDLCKNCEIPK